MNRIAKSEDWDTGEYIRGKVSRLDSQDRGIIGKQWSPIRISGDVEPDQYVTARIVSTDGEYVIAERTRGTSDGRYAVEDDTHEPTEGDVVWVQQSGDTSSAIGWYPKYPFRTFPFIYHSNLFTKQEVGSASGNVTPDEPPWIWEKLHSTAGLVVGFGFLILTLSIIGKLITTAVPGGDLIGQSTVITVFLFIGVALAYGGWFIFEYLMWLIGAIIGGALGVGVGSVLSIRFGVTGGEGLLLTLVTMSMGSGLFGSLFLFLHRIAIMISAFLSVATPLALVLSGGAIVGAELSLTSIWLSVPIAIAAVCGIAAAVLAWVAHKLGLILTTSFLGAAFLVYLPRLAQSGEIGFNFSFIIIFISGVAIQSLYGFGND